MAIDNNPTFYSPADLDQAVTMLQDLGDGALPVAGATWIMRAPTRGEKITDIFVDLSSIPRMHDIDVGEERVSIGAMATQDAIAVALAGHSDLAALTVATGYTANPAIRRAATIGGNIATVDFAASDIVPALLALEAEVEIIAPDGRNMLSMVDFLAKRRILGRSSLIARIVIPRQGRISTHSRITLRKAGDYPVANLSAAISVREDGEIAAACVAVGGVEPVAKRWTGLENTLTGRKLDAGEIRDIAADYVDEFSGRDAPGVPGWYRLRLLPVLAEKAFRFIQKNHA